MPAFLEHNLSGIGIFHCISPSLAFRHQGQSITSGLVLDWSTSAHLLIVYMLALAVIFYWQKAALKK